ncbi:MAG: Rha family transcriptional regulator [Halanaerobiales bacterium]|nr:Rha family transcriptional regulator [Halanaerobiales bacterium]
MNYLQELGFEIRKDGDFVRSTLVAEKFEKRHDHVVRDIEKLIGDVLKIEDINIPKIGGINGVDILFEEINYEDSRGRTQKEYLMNKDAFSLLAMGFNGQKALKWKIKYISFFNKLLERRQERQTEEWQLTRENGKLVRRKETDALALLKIYAEEQREGKPYKHIYENYTKLVNNAVGLKKGERETASFKQLQMVALLEDMIENTVLEEMEKGIFFKEIYKKCKEKVNQFVSLMYLNMSSTQKQKLIS